MKDFKTAFYQILGESITHCREEFRLTQVELAKKLALSRATISNIEKGKHQIQITTLYELAAIFQKEIHQMLPTKAEIERKREEDDKSDLISLLKDQELKDEQRAIIEKLLNNL